MAREQVSLVCAECRRPNYSTRKNRKTHPDRLEIKKYCRHCDRHTSHKETR